MVCKFLATNQFRHPLPRFECAMHRATTRIDGRAFTRKVERFRNGSLPFRGSTHASRRDVGVSAEAKRILRPVVRMVFIHLGVQKFFSFAGYTGKRCERKGYPFLL